MGDDVVNHQIWVSNPRVRIIYPLFTPISLAEAYLAQPMRTLEGWENLGKCRRCGEQRRWFVRAGLDNNQEYVPLSSIRGVGDTPGEPEIDEDDLLG